MLTERLKSNWKVLHQVKSDKKEETDKKEKGEILFY